jgi:hypothetical protein
MYIHTCVHLCVCMPEERGRERASKRERGREGESVCLCCVRACMSNHNCDHQITTVLAQINSSNCSSFHNDVSDSITAATVQSYKIHCKMCFTNFKTSFSA